ncbi:TonB-dependent receptor plug domain-containing protein [candidate division KSB1 bacterium]|nr:TonB-dependent receptor plug domain-containing protein [candidate division KSB1 bacterium]NIR71264.1 TonB-dependent receptor plug domain-containing protein [candidate division KSB1 bacterium]NIS24793.1 TonB-dependent receptor plug domain-containing protein [candidate division KSB1 bacterium]NIT71700.1 TonB-dependent receptor plug domain-containing protein [candidate division KSB1 bacterium]NIU25429.1 TonB-dependent receptor plug domain-containing protein [candidate division KSB1 bacterium]
MRLKFLLILLLLLITAAGVSAQGKGSIKGRVFDAQTKEPLVGVNIQLLDTETGTSTDVEGNFRLTNLPPGSYRLKFTYIGYEPVVRTDVVVSTARPELINVGMKESYVQTETVVVRPKYFVDEVETSVSSTLLSREEIRRFPGGFEDVVRTLATLPGVAVVSEGGRNDLIVRGGGPSENLYLINGIQVPNINHFGNQGTSSGALSFVNLDFINSVEFSTGGFSARYGDKMSSVLALTMRRGRRDRIGGKTTISATQFGLNLEGPIAEQGDFLCSARKSYLDLIFKATGQPFVPVYTDFNLLANYTLSDRDKISFLTLAAIDRVDRDQSTLENRVRNAGLLNNSQNQLIAGLIYQRLLKKGYLDFSVNTNYNRFRLNQVDEFQEDYFKSKADETEFNVKLRSYFKLLGSGGLYSGVTMRRVFNKNNTVFADTVYDRSGRRVPVSELEVPQVTDVEVSAQQFAAYAEWEQDLGNRMNFTLGVRGNYYDFIEESFYPSLRASLNFRASKRLRVKSSIGRYFQSPSYVWVVNPFNKRLKALKNDMVVWGLDYLVRDDLNASLEVYHKSYDDLPTGIVPDETDYLVLTNTGVGFGGREDDFQSFGYIDLVSNGTGKSFGFEVLLQKKYSEVPLYGQISVAVGKSEYTANNGLTYPGQFDQRFVLNISGGYKFNSRWEISGKFRFFTGAPFTPVRVPSENNGVIQNLPEEYLSDRLRNGHHLDVRVDRRFNFNRWTMILFLDIQNIYNYKYQVRPSYDFWENDIEDTNSIGILPSIGISAEF